MPSFWASLTPEQQHALLEGPALSPPPGVLPNFVNPPNRNAMTYGVLFTCASLSALVVAIRVYAKAFCTRRVDIEDYLAVAALGAFGGFLYGSYQMVHIVGSFNHQWNVRMKDMTGFLYNMNEASGAFAVAITLLKASILLEWMRTFVPRGVRNAFYWTCCITILINTMFNIALTLVEIFACTPRHRYWNRLSVEGKCVDEYAVYATSCVLNTSVDILILALPQKVIWTLQVSTRKRIGISIVFAFGVLACVCGTLRLVFAIRFFQTHDSTYAVTPMGLSAWGEITSGFLVLCMPSVPKAILRTPFFQRLMSSIRSRVGYSSEREKNVARRYYFQSWHRTRRVARRAPLDADLGELSTHDLMITTRFSIASRTNSAAEATEITGQSAEVVVPFEDRALGSAALR
ncbi:hypothetical protein K491DRAFT_625977 [Lophiostoma macrostomum CBS 122681]|uniref:Rhodopsin domain-containing protein n=1 Tax=Lophiostoma macrostomum CBS 122681 TaxID=1314788 RepID=A0A6A6TFU5_9PLEO|nr:hypothetical protein K491DRAFT_625977 [Lophiostoma macrostomum CBS 122681]